MALSRNLKDSLNLRKQLAFYGAYHTDPVNIGIHVVGVPIIVFGIHCLLGAAGPITVPEVLQPFTQPALRALKFASPELVTRHAQLNWAAILGITYWCYYALLDRVAAILLLPFWIALYVAAQHAQFHGIGLQAGLAAEVTGWIAQFYGHGVHEGRAPALLDNLIGAIVLAPFFVWLELLFVLGYRPALQKDLHNDTAKLIVQFRKGSAAKKAAAKAKAL